MNPTPALKITALKKTYPNGHQALKGIDLTVPAGSFYALLGPNGAGKSTTISILSTLIPKTEGNVEIFGIDLDTSPSAAKMAIGVVPQEFNFGMFEKVWDILIQQAGYYGLAKADASARAEKYLKLLGLWEKKDAVSRTLSGGMKRRLMIARAMMHEPKLLILDEPTAGVDIELRRSMWEFLSKINEEIGVTIILTTHYLEEAEQLCKYIAIIDRGEIKVDTEMKLLLAQMDSESFVLDLEAPYTQLPANSSEIMFNALDAQTLEVVIRKGQSLSHVFAQLQQCGIIIRSMRNKTNRLEELFLRLVDKNLATA